MESRVTRKSGHAHHCSGVVITKACDPDSPLAPGRPTNGGGTPIPCSVFSCSLFVPVGGAGCALLGEFELKMNLTVLGICVDRVEILHPVKREVD